MTSQVPNERDGPADAQLVMPAWHGFVGVQLRPAMHDTHVPPLLQTRSTPHDVPVSCLTAGDMSSQTVVPVRHDESPA